MKNDLTIAIDTLSGGEYTCVLCKGNEIHMSTKRGVKPLLDWLDGGTDLKDFSAADKVVGRAAAFLYILLGVKAVYAHVMSEGAAYTLEKNGIEPSYDISVKSIINRSGTGRCPMEESVDGTDNPSEALRLIRQRLTELNGDGKT